MIGFDFQSWPALAIFAAGSACAMPKAPELGFSAVGSQADSCCHSASRHENCAAPICAMAYDRASSTLGVGAGAGAGATGSAVAAGAATFCATDVDPRSAPSERATVTARSPPVSSTELATELAIGLAIEFATVLVVVEVTGASERAAAGPVNMRTATRTASAAVVMDAIVLSNRVPFSGWNWGSGVARDQVHAVIA